MVEFISKIQYKTCEKGEFFDEQTRSLRDTLAIIEAFPWDTQRGVSVEPSGPGVVILNDKNEYLKVALYFNNKFSLYYLDAGNHLYEYHTPDLTDECQKVKEFFEDEMGMDGFEKHFFNIGNRAHFVTRDFEYRVTLLGVAPLPLLFATYISILIVAAARSDYQAAFIWIGLTLSVAVLIILAEYFSNRDSYLKLSKGHDEFFFGKEPNQIKTYNKLDIKEVVVYETRSSRSRVRKCEIHMNDGTNLKISNRLISPLRLMSKFKDSLVRIEYTYTQLWKID